ncbi:MAG TPA: 2Fe-2S iron-sulfur cluster-binding protein [Chryseosolibacter sp.]|nr:2Fe-2S iron-sulfur cluster-binding protein [Chryseosolibacter sp.]
MPKITIENLYGKIIEAESIEKTVLKTLHENRIDWMHACGGKGRCTSCKAIIVSGDEHLNQATVAELRFRNIGALKANERLTCQAVANGDILIRAPEEYKLPHVTYSE